MWAIKKHLKSLLNLFLCCFCFMVWFFGHEAYGILAPQGGIGPPVLHWKAVNHWTTRESLYFIFLS